MMRIRVVREAGGLGDLIRLFPVFKGVKEKYPDAELHYYGLEHYRELVTRGHCPYVDKYIAVPHAKRRERLAPLDEKKYKYLARCIQYELQFDMYCPAYLHEKQTDGAVTKERTHLWCEAADVPFSIPKYYVQPDERKWARRWLENLQADPDALIGLQPFGSTKARNWKPENWKVLIEYLEGAGFFPISFDCCGRIRNFPGHLEWQRTYGELGALLELCNFFVGGDSGLFHFAAAVNTPVLGLFGLTNGKIIASAYPHAHWMTCERKIKLPDRCDPPCYGRNSRGWGKECFDNGCALLNAIEPLEVYAKIVQLYKPKSGYVFVPDDNFDIGPKVGGTDFYDEEYWGHRRYNLKSGYHGYNEKWGIHDEIANLLIKHFQLKKEQNILDYGGAFGYHSARIADRVSGISHLVDISQFAIDHCAEAVKGRAHQLDVGTQYLPFQDEFFDFVLAIEIMEHIYITEITFALSELARAMKEGALLYASIALGEARDPRFIDKSHQTMRPREWWDERFRSAGFIERTDIRNAIENEPIAKKMKWEVFAYEKKKTE